MSGKGMPIKKMTMKEMAAMAISMGVLECSLPDPQNSFHHDYQDRRLEAKE